MMAIFDDVGQEAPPCQVLRRDAKRVPRNASGEGLEQVADTPSPRTGGVAEIVPQERVRADLATEILEGIMTFPLERTSERIEETGELTVRVATEILEMFPDQSSGVYERTEVIEVVRCIPKECIQHRTVEEIVEVSLVHFTK